MSYFAIGIYEGKTKENVGTLWRSAYLFGAKFIFTIGKRFPQQPSDTVKTERNIPYYEYVDWGNFMQNKPRTGEVVCIEQSRYARTVNRSNHPKQAIYILGSEDNGIPESLMEGYQKMYIPYEKEQSCNVAVAGSIIMYDRFIRLN